MWPVIFPVLKWLEKRIFFCIFASKQIKSMRATFLNIKLLILITTCMSLLTACHEGRQQMMPMQQTMDSMKMWYSRMQGDSMEAKSRQAALYLQQHENDHSDPMRRMRAEWLKAKGVWFSAIKGMPDSALFYTERAIAEMNGLSGVDELRILAMANRADFYRQLGQLDHSVDGYMLALETADSSGLAEEMKIPLMLGISTAYSFMADYQNSGYWWRQTGELVEQMNKGDQFIYYNNLGNDYYFQEQYSQARDCFIKAVELVKGEEDRKWDYYTALANLGDIYVCLGQADPAHVMIAEADSFFRKVNFLPPLYYLETARIELTLLEGHTQQALQMVNHCEFSDVSIPAAKLLRLKAVEQVMRQTGNYQRAYETHQQLHALSDSIQNANVRMQISTRMLQYEHDKRLLEQQHTIDYERMKGRLAWVSLVVALLAIGLLCVLIWEWRRRQKLHNMEVRQQIVGMRMENTRNRITPHFIYNALTHEMLAQMEGRKVNLESLTQLLRRGIEQADMLETTLAEELSFVDYYVDIERQQMPLALFYEKEIGEKVNLQAVKLPAMTIQIYVENAIKHGLKRQGGKLTVRVSRKENATLVEVIDNGQGLNSTYQEHTGMRVVRQTIQMLNERNQQQITFGIGNIPDGCCSWLLLPDDYNYNFTKI